MELKKIIKSTSFLVFSKMVQFSIGIAKAKMGAVFLGTTGMGIYNQVSYLTTMVSQVTLLSMDDGLVKQIAQNRESHNFNTILKGLIKAYAFLILFSVLLVFMLLILFAKPLTIFFLGDIKYITYYLFGVGSVPIIITNSISFALLKSYKASKQISRANIFSALASFCFFLPLVYYFAILGAVISLAINFLLALYINNYQARKLILQHSGIKFVDLFSAKVERSYQKELLFFAIYGASSGFFSIAAESICRSLLINNLGIDQLGIYSPIIAWAGLLTGFVLPAIQVNLYPRYSECKSNLEIVGILNDYLYLVTFMLIPFVFVAIPYKDILIRWFYSSSFVEAGKYLSWHFIGLMFYMWWFIIALVLTPIGKIRVHSMFLVLMSVINVTVVYLLVPSYGLYGWMLKFVLSPVLFVFVYYFYLRKQINLKIKPKIIALILYSISGSIFLVAIESSNSRLYVCFVLIFISLVFLSKTEREIILIKVKKVFNYNRNKE
jgi:O-antigen/teichoic acid export membrane protein